MPGERFDGQTALVTGGGSGIGEAIARQLAARGARVVVADICEGRAQRVAHELPGAALACPLDVSDEAAVAAAVEEIVNRDGALHLAVNNAGIGKPAGLIHELSTEDWRSTLSVNLDGMFFCMRQELKAMMGARHGAIVNIASVLGVVGAATASAYVTSKHAVVGLTKAAALEYASYGIRVNAICPGFIRTPMVTGRDKHTQDAIAARHPLARLGEPNEVADLAVFLLSERASFVTGSCHLVDGGYSAQ